MVILISSFVRDDIIREWWRLASYVSRETRYREDLVGKRFLSVSGVAKINVNKVSEWGWKAGVIRAASLKDNKNKELQVLVEYDGVDWQRREWVVVHSRKTFRAFLVERTLVWAPKKHENEEVKWPALTFCPLSADVTLSTDTQPVEFLHDRTLQFLDYGNLEPYQEWSARLAGSEVGVPEDVLSTVSSEAAEWRTAQDGQRILTSTPSVLGGCRAQVYRAAGATQWYTAVIVGVNEHTGELTVTDDTVLEEHSEDPALVHMRLLGDGVIESIMRGEVVGVMPRRSRSNLQFPNSYDPISMCQVEKESDNFRIDVAAYRSGGGYIQTGDRNRRSFAPTSADFPPLSGELVNATSRVDAGYRSRQVRDAGARLARPRSRATAAPPPHPPRSTGGIERAPSPGRRLLCSCFVLKVNLRPDR
ncbi:unnamed protein product, partial [Iphiclides podalirius]